MRPSPPQTCPPQTPDSAIIADLEATISKFVQNFESTTIYCWKVDEIAAKIAKLLRLSILDLQTLTQNSTLQVQTPAQTPFENPQTQPTTTDLSLFYLPKKRISLQAQSITNPRKKSALTFQALEPFFGSSYNEALESHDASTWNDLVKSTLFLQDSVANLLEIKPPKNVTSWTTFSSTLMRKNKVGAYTLDARLRFKSVKRSTNPTSPKKKSTNSIYHHKLVPPQKHLYESAVKSAYYGGRIEMFQSGEWLSGPVLRSDAYDIYHIDISSAYPYALSQVPAIADMRYKHVHYSSTNPSSTNPTSQPHPKPDFIDLHSLYEISYCNLNSSTHPNPKTPQTQPTTNPTIHPFPYRKPNGLVFFPAYTKTWVWGSELKAALLHDDPKHPHIEIHQAFVSTTNSLPSTNPSTTNPTTNSPLPKPFAYLADLYSLRTSPTTTPQQAHALKAIMNATYGKTCQRIGWDKEKNNPPRGFQLEYAGMTTAHIRGIMYDLMHRIGTKYIVACETDALLIALPKSDKSANLFLKKLHKLTPPQIQSTANPTLGSLRVTKFASLIMVQSGIWFGFDRKSRLVKKATRGLQTSEISYHDILDGWVEIEENLQLGKPLLNSSSRKSETTRSKTTLKIETTRLQTIGLVANLGTGIRSLATQKPHTIELPLLPAGKRIISIHDENPFALSTKNQHRLVPSHTPKDPQSMEHPLPWYEEDRKICEKIDRRIALENEGL